MTFPHLYRKCREKFLVTNEVALRSHLTEFRDHRLVVTRCASCLLMNEEVHSH